MNYFDTNYQEFIYKRTYARWLEKEKRRENWDETVERYKNFFLNRIPNQIISPFSDACDMIKELQIMPSMRALWSAGPALEKDNIAGYNCSALIIEHPKAFAEILYILMNGAGVGFSVERQFINKMPTIPTISKSEKEIIFRDSKKGWADGFYMILRGLYSGEDYKCNYEKIRPKGSRLKTFGGQASGPEPLQDLIEFTKKTFYDATDRKLNSLECHDIACMVARCVISGGVRRSACLSLSNLSDDRMAKAKTGDFRESNPQRGYANNSVAYTEKPNTRKLISEWIKLMESKSGERGIFNRVAIEHSIANIGRRKMGYNWLGNPCFEVILRPYEFCNLSETICRQDDNKKMLREKVVATTILGLIQSTLTNFKFINPKWKRNCEEERLLGVSLTGLQDNNILNSVSPISKKLLTDLRETAIETAEKWSKILDIPIPAAITCVKPSGTVSQLVNTSSGMHTRFAPYYIRRVQVASIDPIAQFLQDQDIKGYPVDTNGNTLSFGFPQKSPEGSKVVEDYNALQQLEYWKMLKKYWCEHNPSCTIYVKEDEWIETLNWVNSNWDILSGIAFLPKTDHVYKLAPYEEIDEETYESITKSMPNLNFNELDEYEKEDKTTGAQEYACIGNNCEV